MDDIELICDFLKIVEKLGTVRRDIRLTDGSYQSDASHILQLCFLTELVAPFLKQPPDRRKMLELALVHDLAEAECGDIPLCAHNDNSRLKALKKQREAEAIARIRDSLPPLLGRRIYERFEEFENKTSPEARVVYVLDKIEASFSACRYGHGDVRYWAEGDKGEWYYYAAMSGETPQKSLLEELNEPILNRLDACALYHCRRSVRQSGIELKGDFPPETYVRDPLAESIALFQDETEKLCLIRRDNLLYDGTPETDADHIIKLMYLTLLLDPYLAPEYDRESLLSLALVHDLVEARSGDFSLSGQMKHPEWKKLKKAREQEAIAYFHNLLPQPVGARFYDLFNEYEGQLTPDSRLLRVLDKLEATLQANRYHNGDVRYWAECENGSWYYTANVQKRDYVAALGEPAVTKLEEYLINLSRANIEKSAIQVCAE